MYMMDTGDNVAAFIGPGPASPIMKNVMYVGTIKPSFTPMHCVTVLSSRSLEKDRIFQLASLNGTSGTRIDLSKKGVLAHFMFGFSSEGFSYFIISEAGAGKPSKLVRVCQNDTSYRSYTQVPIKCHGATQKRGLAYVAYLGKAGPDLAKHFGIAVHEDVLYVAFASVNKSELCVYSLKSIRQKFTENIQACFNGNGFVGIEPSQKRCVRNKSQIITEDFCGSDMNYPLDGELPIVAEPIPLHDERTIWTITAKQTTDKTLVFTGTSDGHLNKLVFKSPTLLYEYAQIPIKNGSNVIDMHFDNQEINLYVIAGEDVFKVEVHDCAGHSTCYECLNGISSNCGWCNLENKCSFRSDCILAVTDPWIWLPHNQVQRCSTIKSVIPHQVQRTTATTVRD